MDIFGAVTLCMSLFRGKAACPPRVPNNSQDLPHHREDFNERGIRLWEDPRDDRGTQLCGC